MKKLVLICLVLLAGGGAFFYFWQNVLKMRVLRVGIECGYPPNNWEEPVETRFNVPLANKSGAYAEGYDVQIAKSVADLMGVTLEVKKIPWDDLIPALNRNEIDAIFSGMLDTSDRKKLITFSDVYGIQEIKYGVLVHRDGKYAKARKITDFAGAKFVGQRNTNLDRGIYQLPGVIRLPAVSTFAEMIAKLLNHEVDGIIVDFEAAGANEKLHHELVAIRFPPESTLFFDYTGVCAGVRTKDTKLLEEINKALGNISKYNRQRIMLDSIERAERYRK